MTRAHKTLKQTMPYRENEYQLLFELIQFEVNVTAER
jgi:hypothetical protein